MTSTMTSTMTSQCGLNCSMMTINDLNQPRGLHPASGGVLPCAALGDVCLTLTKISKQSALAVTQYLRDYQHQSADRPR